MQISNILLYNNGVIVVVYNILVILLTDKAMLTTLIALCVLLVDLMCVILE